LASVRKYLPEISARFDLGVGRFDTSEEQEFINIHYPYCPNISVDYGIMEKADNVYMQCVDFGWADLGTWGSLFDIADKDENNNAVLKTRALLYECENNIIALGDRDRLIVAQGLKDFIVAENGNALLICKKNDEQRIKQFMADTQLKFDDEFS
jgi:mannose-1-phosphate guanylyltransferase